MDNRDPEVAAINAVNAALSELEDPEGRARVLRWANERFLPRSAGRTGVVSQPLLVTAGDQSSTREVPGIAKLLDDGSFRLTLRDPKAKNTRDAAIRLALITIRAYTQLTGEPSTSSRKTVVPTLKYWRAYDGNTRTDLARYRGLLRAGDALSLDAHAIQEADRFIHEALDGSTSGAWKPTARPRRKSANSKEPNESP